MAPLPGGSPAPPPPPTLGIFDQHHPPSLELIEDCVHCGFCLPTCPTYALWGQEMDSPRGRIYLMKMGLEGQTRMTETYVRHLDLCLGCMACLTACPSGVQYGKLIEATRAQIDRHHPRPWSDRLFRRLLFSLFTRPSRLRVLALPLWLYQATGLRRLFRFTGLLKLLPARLQALEALLPPLPPGGRVPHLPPRTPAQGAPRGRVGLLLGCVQRVFFAEVNAASARVLAAEGYEVVAPSHPPCCGALPLHGGQEEAALALARATIEAFEQEKVDTVVINAAGCGSAMKEYGWLLRDDPDFADRARAFSARCRDISEVLTQLEPRAPRHPLPIRLAYHDPCHLQHAQGISAQPRRLLAGIPGLEIVEIPESAICCGSAGIYNLVEPEAARQLGDRKVQNVLKARVDAVATGNPGCLLQIQSGLERAGCPLPTVHTVELLEASLRNEGLPQLRRRTGTRDNSS